MHNDGDDVGQAVEEAGSGGECGKNVCGDNSFCPFNSLLGLSLIGLSALILLFGPDEYKTLGWLVFFLAYPATYVVEKIRKKVG